MPKHTTLHQFSAGLNSLQNNLELPFEHPTQNNWKVYYDGFTIGATYVDDAYWLIQANGGGTLVVGGEQSMTMVGDGTVFSGYSLYRKLGDRTLGTSGKKFYMETSVKYTNATGGTVPANGIFVGYTSSNEAMTTGASNALDGGDEALGFGQVDTDTNISFFSRQDGTNQTISMGSPFVSGTYTKLQCYYDGSFFNLYRDNNFISRTAQTKLNADEGMTPQVYFEAVEAKANTLDFQYLLFAVEL